ncbi:MAG: VOC family protein [Rudaea sp.]
MSTRVTPCLCFDSQAEDAATFYVSIFKRSKLGKISRYTEAGREIHGKAPGSVMTVQFELDGNAFTALNAGPQFTFSEAISFQVDCADQHEIDYFWARLGDGGEPGPCGWLKDKFGLSWQIVPTILPQLLANAENPGTQRVMLALMQMGKLDIAGLQRAHDDA